MLKKIKKLINFINYLMEETLSQDNKDKPAEEIVDKDKTFNRLKDIQYLIKKESALNGLCK